MTPVDETELKDLPSYRASVAQSVVALDVHADFPDLFRGGLEATTVGDVHLLDVRANAHAVHRTSSLIAVAPQRYFKFSLIERGSGMVVQDGREAVLQPGTMTLYDTEKPYSLVFDDDVRLSIVMFPRELVDVPATLLGRITAKRLEGDNELGAMVRSCLSGLARRTDVADGRVTQRLIRIAFDLVGTLLEAEVGRVGAGATHSDLVRRVLDYIDDHLAQPELGPAQIAAAHFISVRHLHGLFSGQGTTISTVVRTRRLDRCYSDLVNPALASHPVVRIAMDHGFTDAAHFSRLFRQHFGVTPSSVRPLHG